MSEQTAEAASNLSLKKVELLAPHNHADLDYKKGDQIEVTEQEAEWLLARGLIKHPT